MNAIRWVRPGNDFALEFPIFARDDVNGENRNPLYQFALSRCPPAVPTIQNPQMLYYTPISQEDIRWNFEKILFDKNGQPFRRYASLTEPFEMEEDIQFLISKE